MIVSVTTAFSALSQDFGRIVKYYHRIASVLVKFEELFLTAWKSQIEAVRIGLKAPLLRLNQDKTIEVNIEHRFVWDSFCSKKCIAISYIVFKKIWTRWHNG